MSINLNVNQIPARNLSCLFYVLSLIWIFPLSNFILPLILWLLLKEHHINFAEHGKQILNFQITWGLIIFVIWILTIMSVWNRTTIFNIPFGYFALNFMIFGAAILICAAGIATYKGHDFKHLYAYKFIS